MVLYLFYNADLLEDVKKKEMKIAYVDDVNFFAEGTNFEEVYKRLSNMMTCDGGGQV